MLEQHLDSTNIHTLGHLSLCGFISNQYWLIHYYSLFVPFLYKRTLNTSVIYFVNFTYGALLLKLMYC